MSNRKTPTTPAGVISLTDALLRLRLPYGKGRDAALAGRLGPVERRGGRYFVHADVIEELSRSGAASES